MPVTLDNGQHILIGAYTDTLRLMRQVGVKPDEALLSLPMTLMFPDGLGLQFKNWPTPLDALGGILGARGWSATDKWSLLRAALGWQLQGFSCTADLTVTELCRCLTPKIKAELIEPLCVSALNTPAERASAQVFLRVLRDALFGVQGGSRLLLPGSIWARYFPMLPPPGCNNTAARCASASEFKACKKANKGTVKELCKGIGKVCGRPKAGGWTAKPLMPSFLPLQHQMRL